MYSWDTLGYCAFTSHSFIFLIQFSTSSTFSFSPFHLPSACIPSPFLIVAFSHFHHRLSVHHYPKWPIVSFFHHLVHSLGPVEFSGGLGLTFVSTPPGSPRSWVIYTHPTSDVAPRLIAPYRVYAYAYPHILSRSHEKRGRRTFPLLSTSWFSTGRKQVVNEIRACGVAGFLCLYLLGSKALESGEFQTQTRASPATDAPDQYAIPVRISLLN